MDEARVAGKGVCIHVEKNNQAMNLYHRLGFEKAEDKGVLRLDGLAARIGRIR